MIREVPESTNQYVSALRIGDIELLCQTADETLCCVDNLFCQTPPFRLRLTIAEYLIKNEALLEESIVTALYDKTIRSDDLENHSAVREWLSIIGYGDMVGYKKHFNDVKVFLKAVWKRAINRAPS